jgi:hypothetical protein
MLAQHAYGCTSLAAACDQTEARCDLRFSLSQLVTQRHSRGRNAPSSAERSPPSKKKGAGNAGSWPPLPRPQNAQLAAVTIQGSAGFTRHSLHDGFNAYIALSLGTGLSCPHRLVHHHAKSLASASGGQDHTILRRHRHRSSALTGRARCHSAHRIPRSRSVRFGHNAPHKSRRDTRIMLPILRNVKPIFENQN